MVIQFGSPSRAALPIESLQPALEPGLARQPSRRAASQQPNLLPSPEKAAHPSLAQNQAPRCPPVKPVKGHKL